MAGEGGRGWREGEGEEKKESRRWELKIERREGERERERPETGGRRRRRSRERTKGAEAVKLGIWQLRPGKMDEEAGIAGGKEQGGRGGSLKWELRWTGA